MTRFATGSTKWLLLVLVNSLLIQGATYVVRPMVTYRMVEWGANAALIGFIGALYALAPLIFAIQLGRWVDRGRAGTALFVGSLVAILGSILILFSNEVTLLAFAMPLLGMGHLLTMVGGQTLIAKLSPDKSYERNFGLLTFYASLGQAVGPLIGGFLADQGVKVDTGTPIAMAVGLFVLAAVASLPLIRRMAVSAEHSQQAGGFAAVGSLLRTPNFKSALFVSASITAVVDVVTIFLPLLGKQVGLGPAQIGLLLATRSAAAMLIRLLLGSANRKLGPRNLINLGSAVTMFSCIALAFAVDFWLLLLIMVVSGLSMAIGQPASMAWISRITSTERRGLAISVRLTSNRFGQVVVPMISGVIAIGGVGPVFLLLASLQAASWVVTSKSMPKRAQD
jgi:MFS family permease